MRVANGEYYLLITGAFVHASQSHLFFNMLPLVGSGATLEEALGRRRFAALYLLSALAASMAYYLVVSPESVAVGSSGAIYGVLGAWGVTVWGRDRVMTAIVLSVLGVAVWAASVQLPLETMAHAAGGITGCVLALAWRHRQSRRLGWLTRGNRVSLCMTVGLLAAGGLRTVHNRPLVRPWTDSKGVTALASVGDDGTSGIGDASDPSVSADGRLVAFNSRSDLLADDTSTGSEDVFVHDVAAGTTTRVSLSYGGAPSQKGTDSYCPRLSGDGRFVVFLSDSTNLIEGGDQDAKSIRIFVRDLVKESTSRLATFGAEPLGCPSISGDGRIVAFLSGRRGELTGAFRGTAEVFVHDRSSGTTTHIAPAATLGTLDYHFLTRPALSGDGRLVAFVSDASDLVPGDTNGKPDVFVHDRQTGRTTRVSVAGDGTQGDGFADSPSLSADGRFVAFRSSSKLAKGASRVDIFVRDLLSGTVTREHPGRGGDRDPQEPSLSADGRYVAFLVPWNGSPTSRNETVVIDRPTGAARRVSADVPSGQGGTVGDSGPSLSADGRVIAFVSAPEGTAARIYVHDRRRSPRP